MKYLIIILIFTCSLIGCKGEPGPAGPTLSGDIIGHLTLFAEDGLPLQDMSGAKVSIDGSDYSTLTAADGSWKLLSIPAGVYTIVYSKTGFMTVKNFNIQFVGSGTYSLGTQEIGQIPSVTVAQLKIFLSPNDTNNFIIEGTISSADSFSVRVGIFLDKKPIVVSSTMTYLFQINEFLVAGQTSFSIPIGIYDYLEASYRLPSGSQLYARACVLPGNGYADASNPFTGENEVYSSGISFSHLDSLTVP